MDTGARPEEVARMEWDDVLWASHLLRIPNGKTNASAREISMSTRVALRYQHPETGQVSNIMNQRNSQRKTATTEMVTVLVTENVQFREKRL